MWPEFPERARVSHEWTCKTAFCNGPLWPWLITVVLLAYRAREPIGPHVDRVSSDHQTRAEYRPRLHGVWHL